MASRSRGLCSCAICSQRLEKGDNRRKLESLTQVQLSTLKQLASREFPLADVEKLFSSTDFSCRPCFRALESVVNLGVSMSTTEGSVTHQRAYN